jgi:hypothetical protein
MVIFPSFIQALLLANACTSECHVKLLQGVKKEWGGEMRSIILKNLPTRHRTLYPETQYPIDIAYVVSDTYFLSLKRLNSCRDL